MTPFLAVKLLQWKQILYLLDFFSPLVQLARWTPFKDGRFRLRSRSHAWSRLRFLAIWSQSRNRSQVFFYDSRVGVKPGVDSIFWLTGVGTEVNFFLTTGVGVKSLAWSQSWNRSRDWSESPIFDQDIDYVCSWYSGFVRGHLLERRACLWVGISFPQWMQCVRAVMGATLEKRAIYSRTDCKSTNRRSRTSREPGSSHKWSVKIRNCH